MNEITVIFDGQCELCRNSIAWTRKKLEITAIDFHSADLSSYSLTTEECAREVWVICGDTRVSGADAVRYLLNARGNRRTALLIATFGPLSRVGYHWVASHRNSLPVRLLSRALAKVASSWNHI